MNTTSGLPLSISLFLLSGAAFADPPDLDEEGSYDEEAELYGADLLDDLDGPLGPDFIINGEEASEDDYPMTGGMVVDAVVDYGSYGQMDANLFMCSSTLIAPDVVLLAAHCVDEYGLTYGFGTVEELDIYWTRQADLTDFDGSQRQRLPDDAVQAWDWVAHSEFDLNSMGLGLSENYDIALLFLDEAVTDIDHAYLPTREEAAQMEEGNDVAVVGWGQQSATSMWESPPEGSYLVKMMGDSFIAELDEAEFQVGAVEDDVRKCHGDSGGPSFMEVETDTDESTRLIGVTSHAYDSSDCESTGGVDTRVDAYLDWIEAEMLSRCEDGTRAWCEVEGIVPPPSFEDETVLADSPNAEEEKSFLGCSALGRQGRSLPGFVLMGLMGLLAVRRRS